MDALLDFVFNQKAQPIDSKAPVKPHLQEMANPIYTDGKPHLQSWQKPSTELANTHLHNTEITTEITKAEADTAASLNEILVLQNEQDKILLASLIEKLGVEKIGAGAMELIKKGKRPYLSSIQKMLVATEKKEGQSVALQTIVDSWNSSAAPVDPNRKEKMAQVKAKIRNQLAST